MATYTGTGANEVIMPSGVSGSVTGSSTPPGSGSDDLFGLGGNDSLDGAGGNDFLYGGTGNDLIYMGVGFDQAFGGDDIDTLNTTLYDGDYEVNLATGLTNFAGELAMDFENIVSGDGNDVLTGTGSANLMDGGMGDDTIYGGGGSDTISFGTGIDYVFGGAGIDWLDLTSVDTGFEINLDTGDTGFLGRNAFEFENVLTGDGDDNITGTNAANTIVTGLGNDQITSRGGEDSVYGGGGDDSMWFNLRNGVIDGGSGTDTVLFATIAGQSNAIYLDTGQFYGATFLATVINIENLSCGFGNDFVVGTSGANNINGSRGDDTLDGKGGFDTLIGSEGDDRIFFYPNAMIYGGAGHDRVQAGNVTQDLIVDMQTGSTGFASELIEGFEDFFSGTGNDSLLGTYEANLIYGGFGDDTIDGNGGFDDSLYGRDGNDVIYLFRNMSAYGDAGVDTLTTKVLNYRMLVDLEAGVTNGLVTEGFENVRSADGNDQLAGTSGANVLESGGGNDTINGKGGGDTLIGGDGNDVVYFDPYAMAYGGTGVDTVDTTNFALNIFLDLETGDVGAPGQTAQGFENATTGIGNDTVLGTSGVNLIYGGDGDDQIIGVAGNDSLYGGDGDDYILLSVDQNTADGGAGDDDLYTTDFDFDYLINLATGTTGYGEVVASFESVFTGDGNDHLTGTVGVNTLSSSDGNDSLFGGGGRDRQVAGAGADILYGGRGADVLIGGMGHDIFVFTDDDRSFGAARDKLVRDVAKAFQGAGGVVGDLIDLSGIDAKKGLADDQAFVLGGTGRGHLSIVNDGTNTVIRGNTDIDIAFEFELVIKDGAVDASAYWSGDFIL